MAAGLGFKDFTTGEVLTAADVDGYLMQGIWVFASAAARDAAVTSPQEGNFAFLKDTNTTTYYTGSAWTNLDTTGMVNPMTTTGDTIYSSSGSTPARLGIGTAGQVLTVNSGATAPEWATLAAGGGKVLQVVQATTTTTATTSSTSWADTNLSATITPSSATSKVLIYTNQSIAQTSTTNNVYGGFRLLRGSSYIWGDAAASAPTSSLHQATGATVVEFRGQWNFVYLDSPNTTSATTYKTQQAEETTSNNNTVISQNGNQPSSMILLEIGA